MSMQLRTDSRIQELKQELAEFDDEYIKQQTEDIQTDLLLVNEGLEQAKKDVLFIQQRQHKAALEQGATRAEVEKQNGLMINLQASKDALQNIQKKSMTDARLWPVTNEQYEFETQLLELSAFLEVKPGYEGLCEIVFSHIASP